MSIQDMIKIFMICDIMSITLPVNVVGMSLMEQANHCTCISVNTYIITNRGRWKYQN